MLAVVKVIQLEVFETGGVLPLNEEPVAVASVRDTDETDGLIAVATVDGLVTWYRHFPRTLPCSTRARAIRSNGWCLMPAELHAMPRCFLKGTIAHHPLRATCVAWLGLAWLGLAWLGLAWLGLAWLGLAWRFSPGPKAAYFFSPGPKGE